MGQITHKKIPAQSKNPAANSSISFTSELYQIRSVSARCLRLCSAASEELSLALTRAAQRFKHTVLARADEWSQIASLIKWDCILDRDNLNIKLATERVSRPQSIRGQKNQHKTINFAKLGNLGQNVRIKNAQCVFWKSVGKPFATEGKWFSQPHDVYMFSGSLCSPWFYFQFMTDQTYTIIKLAPISQKQLPMMSNHDMDGTAHLW